MVVSSPNFRILYASRGNGAALSYFGNPPYPNRFWMVGDMWFLTSPKGCDAYFVMATDSMNKGEMIAAGYSLGKRQIIIARVVRQPDSSLTLIPIAVKRVEILNMEHKYVFKWIVYRKENVLQIDVNGVPFRMPSPLPVSKFTCFGYLIHQGVVKFKEIKIEGD